MKKIKLKAWIAKDLSMGAGTFLYIEPPKRCGGVFLPSTEDALESLPIPTEQVPKDLSWFNSPREVEVRIKEIKKRKGWFR